jgi:hypothetical protein
MTNFITKLFLGENICKSLIKEGALERRMKNLNMIWHGDDYGIERVIRLFLAVSQFIFIGTYVRQLFGSKSSIRRDMSIDFLVIIKIVFSFTMVRYGWWDNNVLICILLWFSIETLLYIPTLIFASDYLARPRSYKRSLLLFFFNYIEITTTFSSLYSKWGIMSNSFKSWHDAVYFSFITGSTTGYGDFYPINYLGKFLVVSQSIIFMVFVVLCFNVFSNKIETNGYFQSK